jgi:hypothetical protein
MLTPPLFIKNWPARIVLGQIASLIVGLALIFPAVLVPQRWRTVALVAWAVVTAYAFLRAFRVRVALRDNNVEVKNYLRTYRLSSSDLVAIKPTAVLLPNPVQWRQGCAGFATRSSPRVIPAHATMSWRWRLGGPSRSAVRLTSLLSDWGHRNGLEVSISPKDLV